jgi:hypothetical protein
MSKMDNLRAMREARYEESQARARAGSGSAGSKPSVAAKAPAAGQAERMPTLAVVPDPPEQEQELQEALCGHRNMSGRTCTREAGHAAKSHRYS